MNRIVFQLQNQFIFFQITINAVWSNQISKTKKNKKTCSLVWSHFLLKKNILKHLDSVCKNHWNKLFMCHSPVLVFLLLLFRESERRVSSRSFCGNIRRRPAQREELSGEAFTNCRHAAGGNNRNPPRLWGLWAAGSLAQLLNAAHAAPHAPTEEKRIA